MYLENFFSCDIQFSYKMMGGRTGRARSTPPQVSRPKGVVHNDVIPPVSTCFSVSSVENFIGHKFTYKHVALSYLFRLTFFPYVCIFFRSPFSRIFYNVFPSIQKFYLARFIYAREFSLPFPRQNFLFSYSPPRRDVLKLTNEPEGNFDIPIIISFTNG